MKDYLFGQMRKTKGFPAIPLVNLLKVARHLTPEHFVKQLNRLVAASGGALDITDETSMPDFQAFLERIPSDDVHLVNISKRTDLNDSVDATLDCTLFIEGGMVRVSPQWCAYKYNRAIDIIDTLLKPLFEKQLLDRTFIDADWDDEELVSVDNYLSYAPQVLFTLAGYPDVARSVSETLNKDSGYRFLLALVD